VEVKLGTANAAEVTEETAIKEMVASDSATRRSEMGKLFLT
jgi:hypothetical protein